MRSRPINGCSDATRPDDLIRCDIAQLFAFFAAQAGLRYERPVPLWDAVKLRRMFDHDWPGNVREQLNAAVRAVLGVVPPGAAPGAENERGALALSDPADLLSAA